MNKEDKRIIGLLAVNATFMIAAIVTGIMAIASVFTANWPHALGYLLLFLISWRIFERVPTQ